MALGRCRIFPCHLVRNRPTDQPTISSIHAINAPTRHRLDPTIRTGAFRPDPSCTVAAPEISIAPADRAAPFSRGFLPWRLTNAGPAAVAHIASTVMGPASETRHKDRLIPVPLDVAFPSLLVPRELTSEVLLVGGWRHFAAIALVFT